MTVCDRYTKAEVLVIKGRGMSLLGKITATELGVLKVGINIAMVTSKADSLKQQYPEIFEGVGKTKNEQISLNIDPTVKPIAQPSQRTAGKSAHVWTWDRQTKQSCEDDIQFPQLTRCYIL